MADDDNAGKKLANFDNMWNAGCGIEPKLRQWRSMKYGKQVLSLTLLVLRRGSLLSARSMSGRSKGGNCPMFKNYMLVCGTAAQHFDNEWLCFNTSFAKIVSPTRNSAHPRTLFSKIATAGDCRPYAKLTQAALPAALQEEGRNEQSVCVASQRQVVKCNDVGTKRFQHTLPLDTWVQCC